MIRIIRMSTLNELWDELEGQERELTGRGTRIGQLEAEIEGLRRVSAKAREDEAGMRSELYVQLGEAAQEIERLTALLKKVTGERDDARGDLATITKAADAGLVRVVPGPRREATDPAAAPEAGMERRVFGYPHESTEPALVVEHADQGCRQCMEAIRLLSLKGLQAAMVVARNDGLVIAQVLILNELRTRVQSDQPEEGQA